MPTLTDLARGLNSPGPGGRRAARRPPRSGALRLPPLILMTEVRELRLVESDLLPALVLTALATLVYEGTILLTLAVTGERIDWLVSLRDVLAPAAIANTLLLLPVYGLVRLASPNPRRRQAF